MYDPYQITKDQYKNALQQGLTESQSKMLQFHYYAPHHDITATELARKMGYKSFEASNAIYGRFAGVIGKRIGFDLEALGMNLSILVDIDKPYNEWHWIMLPNLVKALEELGIVDKNLVREENNNKTDTSAQTYLEGTTQTSLVTTYERNPEARRKCIEYYGNNYNCCICGFNFKQVYGDIGEGFIHVHHKESLSESGQKECDPIKDLIPVCPNCHAMLHRGLSVEELKDIINENK